VKALNGKNEPDAKAISSEPRSLKKEN